MDDYEKYYEKYLKYKNKYLELKQAGGVFFGSRYTKEDIPNMPDTTPFILILSNNTILSEANFITDSKTNTNELFTLDEIHEKLDYNVCHEKRSLSYIITHRGKLLELCYNRKNFNCGKKLSNISSNEPSNHLDDYKKLSTENLNQIIDKSELQKEIDEKKAAESTFSTKSDKEQKKFIDDEVTKFKNKKRDEFMIKHIPIREASRIENRETKISSNETTIDLSTLETFTKPPSIELSSGPLSARSTNVVMLQQRARQQITQLAELKQKLDEFENYRFAHIVLAKSIILKDPTNPNPSESKILDTSDLNVIITELTGIINKYIQKFHETCYPINTYAVIKYHSESNNRFYKNDKKYKFEIKPTSISMSV